MPQVEVDSPQWKRDQRVGKHPKPVEETDRSSIRCNRLIGRQDRGQQWPGEAEHNQKRRDVRDQKALDHVHKQQFLAGLPHPDQGEGEHEAPA